MDADKTDQNKEAQKMRINYRPFIAWLSVLTATLLLVFTGTITAQGLLKAEVVNTNCPTSSKEAETWYFGQNAGIDFTSGDAVPLTDMSGLNVPQGNAVISDSLGNLLFYTDGMTVYDRRRNPMPNGSGLGGNPGVTQPAIIVPRPGPGRIYYIFTVDLLPFFPGDTTKSGFSYTEIDMDLNNGYGDVTSIKKKQLLPLVSSKVSAVRHGNGVDYWVVTHEYNSSNYCSFLVSESGVDSVAVKSSTGIVQSGDLFTNNFVGNMKISPDGTKIASAIYGLDVFEIANFNVSNGTVNGAVTSPPDYKWAYGVAFSADNSKLYGSTAYIGGNPDSASSLYQFDVTQGGAIFDNPVLLDENTTGRYYCGMQQGPDGRIYIARAFNYFGFGEMSVIYNPDRPGLACNLDMINGSFQDFSLGGKISSWGTPNFMQSYFDLPHFNVDSVCLLDSTMFRLRNEANIASVEWNFGDPGSNALNTSTDIRPFHRFTDPGTYQVTVTEFYGGESYTYTESVTVNELPYTQLPDTIFMYQGSSVRLDAGMGFSSYLWSNGETSDAITVNEPGDYWVVVENQKCCFNLDSVKVILFDIIVPNAFRPGGVNSVFRPIPTAGVDLNRYQMFIYNRWGQLIFESNSVEEGWDGTVNGEPAPGDVYVWLINYFVERDGGDERVTRRGNLMLLK